MSGETTMTTASKRTTMTERPTRPTPRKPPPRVRPGRVYAATACAFLAATGGLAAQMASGHDPSLMKQSAAAPPARTTTVKRVIRTVVVTKVVRHKVPEAPAVSQASTGSAPPAQTYAAPTTSSQAPAPAAAAPAPAPTYTPAPAPAAPTTRSS